MVGSVKRAGIREEARSLPGNAGGQGEKYLPCSIFCQSIPLHPEAREQRSLGNVVFCDAEKSRDRAGKTLPELRNPGRKESALLTGG